MSLSSFLAGGSPGERGDGVELAEELFAFVGYFRKEPGEAGEKGQDPFPSVVVEVEDVVDVVADEVGVHSKIG
jgi:hypothetical protein